jgi:hypothetical protein
MHIHTSAPVSTSKVDLEGSSAVEKHQGDAFAQHHFCRISSELQAVLVFEWRLLASVP